jgi:hypothetical protein
MATVFGSGYTGDREQERMDGRGRYEFADGSVYVGTFKDGKFDGEGTLFLPDGLGKHVGTWSQGVCVRWNLFYADGTQCVSGDFRPGRDERLFAAEESPPGDTPWDDKTQLDPSVIRMDG